mmetsp:Transcript_33406/g.38015  ORF Transcript_33406/g.38015 Transcript_33406/m.38015 type:complete len:159 (-) Transcript_33406:90-566(-)
MIRILVAVVFLFHVTLSMASTSRWKFLAAERSPDDIASIPSSDDQFVILTIDKGRKENEYSITFRADNTIHGYLTTSSDLFSSEDIGTTNIHFSFMMSSKMMPSDEFADAEYFLEYDIPEMKTMQKIKTDDQVILIFGGPTTMKASFILMDDDGEESS